jgi:phosphopantothenoylcysteine synthetase/decarboxylase
MAALSGRTIVLGVSGSVAAYKAAEIARRLIDAGAQVTAVLTAGAQEFITPLTFTAITGRPALTDSFALPQGAMPHLDIAKSAAAVLLAPASANTLARLATGFADDLLTSILLVTRAPVFLAPAMHAPMWTHPATQRNVETLKGFGHKFLGPATGALASGDQGIGRLLDPETIVAELIRGL